ncbi:S41 family peptidase [Rapidithrix thailandica]|uniref:S41 family peptidase n=1 Tax=Rapidithrix thailandica TaxID=413964 RepID=A0AAW9SB81_9BACT
MMSLKLLFFINFLPFTLFAQTELTEKQLREDYTIFKNVLTGSHPGLYKYTTKAEWDSIFSDFEAEITHINNAQDFFKKISALALNVRDGHLRILHPTMDTIPTMFPLLVKIIDGKLFTDTGDFGIPLGSEIIAIDRLKSQELIQRMLKYAPSDGYNTTKKHRQIEFEFGILLYYELGAKSGYTVTYHTPDHRIHTSKVKSQSFQSIGIRNPYRSSYFSSYHRKVDKVEHAKHHIQQKLPFVYFIDSINTAVLTVNSFGIDPQEFKSEIIDIFKEIKRQKATSLIIDVRQNIGGYRANAITLFSYLSDRPFKQRISETAITSGLIEADYKIHTMSGYTEFFNDFFANAENRNGRWILTTDKAEETMKPYKRPFKGNTYVLIGGNTFSAGSAFALSAKNNPQIKLIGEETGGGYYFHTGQFPVFYKLPHSKIVVNMSLVNINHYVKDNSVPEGSGILPDYEVTLTQKDLINGTDGPLDYIIKKLKYSKQ